MKMTLFTSLYTWAALAAIALIALSAYNLVAVIKQTKSRRETDWLHEDEAQAASDRRQIQLRVIPVVLSVILLGLSLIWGLEEHQNANAQPSPTDPDVVASEQGAPIDDTVNDGIIAFPEETPHTAVPGPKNPNLDPYFQGNAFEGGGMNQPDDGPGPMEPVDPSVWLKDPNLDPANQGNAPVGGGMNQP